MPRSIPIIVLLRFLLFAIFIEIIAKQLNCQRYKNLKKMKLQASMINR